MLILVTGATGHIASRLIPRLLERGHPVRALARDPRRLDGRAWSSLVELIPGDVMDAATLPAVLAGVHTAYYLIHNMSSGRGYTERELVGARNFACAAAEAGVRHIIYLGGLADPEQHIAPHMRSRIETGAVLRQGSVPVTEFRAGVIAGSGSISFEMIRFMTELFPVIPGPAWLRNKSQPIAVQNIVDYLLAALDNWNGHGQIFEIGGTEVTTYADLMLRFARVRGHKRSLVLLSGIPVWFMAFGIGLTTPVPRSIAHALVGGLSSDSVVLHDDARRVFPDVQLLDFDTAVQEALTCLHPARIERVWDDGTRPVKSLRHEGFFIEHHELQVEASPEQVFQVLAHMGGKHGWPFANWLWRLRGWLDHLFPHFQPLSRRERGRGEGEISVVHAGDRVDYYTVEAIEPNRLLLLHSDLRAPGEGWMEWRVRVGRDTISTYLTQTAFFAPRGLGGFLYWYALYPFYTYVFRGLIKAIARKAKHQESNQANGQIH